MIIAEDYASNFAKNFGYPEEWHKRELPHRDKQGLLQFITFRLADSIPKDMREKIEREVEVLPEDKKDIARRKRYQDLLDNGLGCCALSNKEMALIMQKALMHNDGSKYNVLAWCIMPNHIHILIKANENLAKIVQSWKSFTGKWALANNEKFNLRITTVKEFWMKEYWDRFIRDEKHFNNTIEYILNNPENAKLEKENLAYKFRGVKLERK